MKRGRAGFTLVELLVVLVIISVLAALLLPLLGAARESARATSCVSQLRQLHQAVMMYSEDADGHFPFAVTWEHTTPSGKLLPGIRRVVAPYARSRGIFYCPSLSQSIGDHYGVGYAYVADLAGIHDWEAITNPPPYEGPAAVGGPWRLVVSEGDLFDRVLHDPSGVPMLHDLVTLHNRMANVVWVDSHISRLSTTHVVRYAIEQPGP